MENRISNATEIAKFLGWEIINNEVVINHNFYSPRDLSEVVTGNYHYRWDIYDFMNNITWDLLHYIINKIKETESNSPIYNQIINAKITTDFDMFMFLIIKFVTEYNHTK